MTLLKAHGRNRRCSPPHPAFPCRPSRRARAIKLGYVSPQTGPLAAFAEADNFIIDEFPARPSAMPALNFEVIVKDSQSNPNRAAEVAKELIVDDEVNLMLVASTPETTNPVADDLRGRRRCPASRPWRRGSPGSSASRAIRATRQRGSRSTTPIHFFWGLEDVIAVFTNMWGQLETNKNVGGLFPNDGDGNAWGDPDVGFPPVLAKSRLHAHRSGPLPEPDRRFLGADQRLQGGQCRDHHRRDDPAGLHHVLDPGASQQGFKPKAASIGKAILFPQAVEALGNTGHNLSSEVWWSPSHPFKSSLTGVTLGRARRRPSPRRPAGRGRSRSASSMRCSSWPST